jgi:hypothetical protein
MNGPSTVLRVRAAQRGVVVSSQPRLKTVVIDQRHPEHESRALEHLSVRFRNGDIRAIEMDESLVELVLERVADLPSPIIAELRAALREAIATDPYFVESRARHEAEVGHDE